jgi:hypothetical protein
VGRLLEERNARGAALARAGIGRAEKRLMRRLIGGCSTLAGVVGRHGSPVPSRLAKETLERRVILIQVARPEPGTFEPRRS